MLQQVDDQICIEACPFQAIQVQTAHFKGFLPIALLLAHQKDRNTDNHRLEDPLDNREGCEALVPARLLTNACAKQIVEGIKAAKTTGDRLDLNEEAQVIQKCIIEKIKDGQDYASRNCGYVWLC